MELFGLFLKFIWSPHAFWVSFPSVQYKLFCGIFLKTKGFGFLLKKQQPRAQIGGFSFRN